MADGLTSGTAVPGGHALGGHAPGGHAPGGHAPEVLAPEVLAPEVLALTGLSWSVGGSAILSGVDLAVGEGEFVAVIGPNGAGKTSLFNLISGLTRATAGRIVLDGADITTEAPHKRARRGVGRTFQSSSVFPTMTVAEHVALAQQVAAKRRGRTLATDALEHVRLAEKSEVHACDLSHGDKRKLELAMLLASGAERLLLLDEPMAGVASGDVPELVDVIRALHQDEHRTILMVEHHMEVLLGLADRVAVLHHGALLAIDTPERVMADERVQEAYVGDSL
ncbi:ABC transporter ATP-binding protein [Catenulispora sp. NL8]|uniref:ABC transporter ATP-binding protein n=1 Tax=Catenulispora pinistramenti TaxID=2705254 RepID=A0ABS5KHJ0_9ACTN|nr:ABC transporter ATP-binding protein [Catenulispora pinistramenti]